MKLENLGGTITPAPAGVKPGDQIVTSDGQTYVITQITAYQAAFRPLRWYERLLRFLLRWRR